jgi:hypothetical protein
MNPLALIGIAAQVLSGAEATVGKIRELAAIYGLDPAAFDAKVAAEVKRLRAWVASTDAAEDAALKP